MADHKRENGLWSTDMGMGQTLPTQVNSEDGHQNDGVPKSKDKNLAKWRGSIPMESLDEDDREELLKMASDEAVKKVKEAKALKNANEAAAAKKNAPGGDDSDDVKYKKEADRQRAKLVKNAIWHRWAREHLALIKVDLDQEKEKDTAMRLMKMLRQNLSTTYEIAAYDRKSR